MSTERGAVPKVVSREVGYQKWESGQSWLCSGQCGHGCAAPMLEPLCSQLTWVPLHCHGQWRVYSHTGILANFLYRCTLCFPPEHIPPSHSIPGTSMSTGVIKCRVACGAHASVLLQRKDFLQEKNDHFHYFAGCPSKPIIAWHLHTKGKDPANLWVGTMPSEQMGMEVGSQ